MKKKIVLCPLCEERSSPLFETKKAFGPVYPLKHPEEMQGKFHPKCWDEIHKYYTGFGWIRGEGYKPVGDNNPPPTGG